MATKGSVKGIVSNLVTIEADGPVAQNEICYITVGGVPLMSEVIRVNGKNAYAQVGSRRTTMACRMTSTRWLASSTNEDLILIPWSVNDSGTSSPWLLSVTVSLLERGSVR